MWALKITTLDYKLGEGNIKRYKIKVLVILSPTVVLAPVMTKI
jgi:hypothetical protein